MYKDSGSPAFDNIDDLLADKIVHHSRNHSGSDNNAENSNDTNPEDTAEYSSEEYALTYRPPLIWILILLTAIMTMIYLFYRATHKK